MNWEPTKELLNELAIWIYKNAIEHPWMAGGILALFFIILLGLSQWFDTKEGNVRNKIIWFFFIIFIAIFFFIFMMWMQNGNSFPEIPYISEWFD
jgi:hypothetical protein